MKYFYTLVFMFVVGFYNSTQAQFTVVGEIRPRGEFRNGFKKPDTKTADPAFFIEQRSRLYFGYKTDKLGFKIALQDVRVWGGASQIYKEDQALTNVYEAWGEYFFKPTLSLRVGRQELDYDNARFLGNLDWAAQGRSHDAVRLMYADSTGFTLHVGAAFNQNVPFEPGKLESTFYEGVNNYKTMQYIWVHKEGTFGKISGLIFNNGQQLADSTTAFSQTYGIIGETNGKVKIGGELYYQGGKDGAGNDLSAWLVAANATFQTSVTPITIGVDYVSGTGADATKNNSFNPLYGTNHKFYGYMDYFYVGNNHGQNGKTAGLLDYYLTTKFKTGEKSALLANFHHFQSPTKVYATESSQNELSSTLAEEIDLVYNLNMSSDVNLKVGYSQLFSTESLEALKGTVDGSGFNSWAWVMLSFKPAIFSK